MAPQCISRRWWCSPWPLLGQVEVRLKWAGWSELGQTSCSTRVPWCWSAYPRQRIPFFWNRRGYCCTNTRMERSFMLEGLAVEAASTGWRTGSCCCSCCRSAISVGEARWSGPLELPQCRTAPLHCPSTSQQLLSTVCQCLQTAPLHCLLVGHDSSTSNPARKRQLLLGSGVGNEGKQVGSMNEEPQGCYNITFICTPTNQETV